ncbi:SIS domain-containing protein [Leifsonia sp. NPDC056665]|uniref:SIS domain-containing protein n=1 Tax=Leifsonia sp. NPDC056665 TaxID=3345901 RepID=UPI003688BE4B
MTTLQDTQDRTKLREEIPTQGDALAHAATILRLPVENLLALAKEREITDWVVTGCGDSLFSGLCGEVWFAGQARNLRAVHAMELSRYKYRTLGPNSLVLAISHSGTTARVVEAAKAARAAGALTVAVTANASSELARIADLVIDNSVHNEESNTRTRSFQAVALFIRMISDQLAGIASESRYSELAHEVGGYTESAEAQVSVLPDEIFQGADWTVVGAGLGHAMSEYGKAKLYEAATVPAHAEELEQYIHCEIFTATKDSVIVIVAPKGPATSRAHELAGGLAKLGAKTIAITDDEELAALCAYSIALPTASEEIDLPFFAAVPLQWLALRLALARGENPDRVANKWVNRPLIDHSLEWAPTSNEGEANA